MSVEEDSRQEWTFTLYDFDNNGKVTREVGMTVWPAAACHGVFGPCLPDIGPAPERGGGGRQVEGTKLLERPSAGEWGGVAGRGLEHPKPCPFLATLPRSWEPWGLALLPLE